MSVKNIIKEFTDMKTGAGFLRNIERIARALEIIAAHLITISNTLEKIAKIGDVLEERLESLEITAVPFYETTNIPEA